MGWLEGMLGGFVEGKNRREDQNRRDQELASQREQNLYATLLHSDNPEAQSYGLSGLLESAQPGKRKRGLSGWMGQIEQSPIHQQIRQWLATPQTREITENVQQGETLPSRQGAGVAALPSATSQLGISEPPAEETPAAMPAGAQVTGTAATPPPPMTWSQAPPQPLMIQRKRTETGPVRIFNSPMEKQIEIMRGKSIGDIQGDVAGLESVGVPHEKAVAQVLLERQHGRGLGGRAAGFQHVPVEMPDKSQRIASYEPTTGAIFDADELAKGNRVPLTGARVLSHTASTSLGSTFEQAAKAGGYNRGSDVPPGDVERIKGIERDLAAQQAGAVTGARGVAENQTKMNAPIALDKLAENELPVGTSMADIAGMQPVTDDQKKRHDAAKELAPQIDEIDQLIPLVFPAGAGLRGALSASQVLAAKRVGRDPYFARLDSAINLAVGNVSRVLAAETGRLTQQDIERAKKALVDMQGWTDTQETAQVKLAYVKAALKRVRDDIKTPGEVLRGRQGAATPPPTGVSPVAPQMYKDGAGIWHIRQAPQ